MNNKANYSPIMTLSEVVQDLRDCGVKTSIEKLRAGIQQNKYPFGISIEMDSTRVEIYRKLYEEWKIKCGIKHLDITQTDEYKHKLQSIEEYKHKLQSIQNMK